jgi:hypothetical protein
MTRGVMCALSQMLMWQPSGPDVSQWLWLAGKQASVIEAKKSRDRSKDTRGKEA